MAKKVAKKAGKKAGKQAGAAESSASGTDRAVKKVAKKAAKKVTKKAAGKKAENKTAPTRQSVAGFLAKVDAKRRPDCERLIEIIGSVVGEGPVMWGASIVGFGKYHYVYESGRQGDMPLAGFSARSNALVIYIPSGHAGEAELMARLGKHTTGKSCLYIKSLADVDEGVLEELIRRSVAEVRRQHPG
jgi:hypothetical protein